jgi:hypothetical protein
MGAASVLDYDELVLRWMDRWLKDAANGVDTEPPVRTFVMGAKEWRTGAAWPPEAERRALYLSGRAAAGQTAGALVWEAPAPASASVFVSDGARPVRDPHDGDFGGLDFRALSTLDGVVTFETAPLTEDIDVQGPIRGSVHISVDAPDTDLWLKVLTSRRTARPWNVMSAGLDVVRASYRNRRAARELLQPGEIYRIDFPTLMTGNRFAKGHRVCAWRSWRHSRRTCREPAHRRPRGRLEDDGPGPGHNPRWRDDSVAARAAGGAAAGLGEQEHQDHGAQDEEEAGGNPEQRQIFHA